VLVWRGDGRPQQKFSGCDGLLLAHCS